MNYRVCLSPQQALGFFSLVQKKNNETLDQIAQRVGYSPRTVRDWKRGKYSMPLEILLFFKQHDGVEIPQEAVLVNDAERKKNAGSKGAIKRNSRRGNPGTPEGRIKGGYNSLKTHAQQNTAFRVRLKYAFPRKSAKLAELMGILYGDGGIRNSQLRVTLDVNEPEYAKHVGTLLELLFKRTPSYYYYRNVREVALSGVELVGIINKLGMPTGNKLTNNIDIPAWISDKLVWQRAFLRGFFDTDGSVYLDKHAIKGKKYASICVALTSYTPKLYASCARLLTEMGYHPTYSSKHRLILRRRPEVIQFFQQVKPSNVKHIKRFNLFLEE